MTDPRTPDRLLAAWFEAEAPASPPDALRSDIDRATSRIRPRPAWLARLRGNPMDVIVGGAGRRNSRLIPVFAVLLLTLALVAGALYVGSQRQTTPVVVVPSTSPTSSVAATASPSLEPTPGSSPINAAAATFPYNVVEIIVGDDDAMWVSVAGEDTRERARAIYRVDPQTAEATLVVDDVTVPPSTVVVFVQAQDSIWAPVTDRRLLRFDATSGDLLGEIPVGDFPLEPLAAFGSVWSENYADGTVTRIDATTGDVVATIEIERFAGGGPRDLAFGSSLLYAVNPGTTVAVGIDPGTNSVVRELPISDALHCGISVWAGRVWVETCEGTITTEVFDDATGAAQGSYQDRQPIADDGTVVWTAQYDPDSTKLKALDPATLTYTGQVVDLGVPAGYVTSGFGAVWFSDGLNLHRLPFEALGSN